MTERLAARLADPRVGWALLAIAMVAASVAILHAGRGLSFTADELYALARLVDEPRGATAYAFGLEYLLAPHNGHLQAGGKLIYEALLALFGADHAPFRVAGLLGVLSGVGLAFELARTRVGVPVALAGAVTMLFCGAAWEVMLWPYDLHTTYAFALGLGAVLALDRMGRRADPLVCLLLVASLTMIEAGLPFVVGIGVALALRRDWRRLWVAGVPAALYGVWWLWARSFEHEGAALENLAQVPGSIFESLVAVCAALTGAYGRFPEHFPWELEPTAAATVVAMVAAACLAYGFWRATSIAAVGAASALLTYWAFIGLADRPEDSSRYVWVGAILLLLLAAELARRARLRGRRELAVAAVVLAVTAVAFPAGREKLDDGRTVRLSTDRQNALDFAMIELADSARTLPRAEPGAVVEITESGGLDAAGYLSVKDRIGSLAMPLRELRKLDRDRRSHADVVLARALGLRLEPADRPPGRCDRARAGEPVELAAGGAVLRSANGGEVALARFAPEGPSVSVGELQTRRWSELRIPADSEPEPWVLFTSAPTRVCPPG